jgi:hypothetical protein
MITLNLRQDQTVLAFLTETKMNTYNREGSNSTRPLRKLSQQMQAVMMIFNADEFLMEAVSPFIDLDTETIYWDKILKLPFGSGHKGAIRWAYGVWTDDMPKGNCFDGALSMSPFLKVGVLEALCLRWGLRG